MLDYEIETWVIAQNTHCNLVVEKKRCSITRLKRDEQGIFDPEWKNSWKEKMLDYEIETLPHHLP